MACDQVAKVKRPVYTKARQVLFMGWIEHKRSDSQRDGGGAFVSLRPSGIAFSAAFASQSGAQTATRVSILVDPQRRRLGFRFHAREDDANAYAVSSDGGHSRGRWAQCGRLYSEYEWLGDALARTADERRFKPERDPKDGIWFITVLLREQAAAASPKRRRRKP